MNSTLVKNQKVHVFFRKPLNGQFSIENVFNTLLPFLQKKFDLNYITLKYPSRGFLTRIRIGLSLRKQQAYINHISGDIHFVAPFLDRKRTILTIHDCNFLNRNYGIKKWLLKLFWLYLPLRQSQIITTISKASADEISRYTGYPYEQIRIIPNPLPAQFSYVPKIFNEEKPVILQVGTKENKNIPRLLEALRDIPCHLEIVGPLSNKLNQLLLNYGIEYTNSINLSEQELLLKYHKCDMVTLISTEEGFGLPIIEAKATGRPVVTSNVSSMPEVASGAACLVDPFDVNAIRQGIQKIIQDNNYREQLIQKGLESVKQFEAESIAKKYEMLYNELITELNEKTKSATKNTWKK